MEDLATVFLSQKIYAVAGSFRDETKYAYKVFRQLKNKGLEVYPVNPSAAEVDGIKCYPSIKDIPEKVDALSLVTPPKATEEIVKLCLEKGVKIIWMQPGAESEKAIEFCNNNGIKVISNACILLA